MIGGDIPPVCPASYDFHCASLVSRPTSASLSCLPNHPSPWRAYWTNKGDRSASYRCEQPERHRMVASPIPKHKPVSQPQTCSLLIVLAWCSDSQLVWLSIV